MRRTHAHAHSTPLCFECVTWAWSAHYTERARPSTRERTLVDFLGILCVSNHVTHAYAHAHFSNKRVIRELRIVSCPGGGVWVAVTREFERDNCVISEILQSDWTIPNRARKSTRPSFRVWAGRSGHETRARASMITCAQFLLIQHRVMYVNFPS